ncbi:SRPBCC family protein [Micromonospora sp. NPDC003197]
MRAEKSVDIAAPADLVWTVWVDVEQWPQWAESVSRVRRLDEGPLTVGSRTRLEQPRLRPAIWQVTELDPGNRFVWTATSGGVTTVAGHRIVPVAPNRVRAELTIEHSGLLAPLVGWLTSSLTRRYLHLEAEGLKHRCESGEVT